MVFPRNSYISRESIRLGIKRCNCNCSFQEINSQKQKKLHVIILMTRVLSHSVRVGEGYVWWCGRGRGLMKPSLGFKLLWSDLSAYCSSLQVAAQNLVPVFVAVTWWTPFFWFIRSADNGHSWKSSVEIPGSQGGPHLRPVIHIFRVFAVRIFRIFFRVFRAFGPQTFLKPLFLQGGETIRIFRIFASGGPNCKIRKIRQTGLILTGFRWKGQGWFQSYIQCNMTGKNGNQRDLVEEKGVWPETPTHNFWGTARLPRFEADFFYTCVANRDSSFV